MNWIILALIAPFLWAIGSVISKFIRVKYIQSVIGYLVVVAPACLFSLLFLFFGKFEFPPNNIFIYLLLSGITAVIAYYLFILALHQEEISTAIIIYGTVPLFTLLLATLFLKELLRTQDYIAFALIIIGTFMVSFKKIEEKLRLSKEAILILISSFLFATQSIFLKLSEKVNFTSAMIIREIAFGGVILLIFLSSNKVRIKANEMWSKFSKKSILIVYFAEILGIIGIGFSYLALQRAPVSLVALLEGFEAPFVLVIALFISRFFPKILKEEIKTKTITIKIISIILMVGGLYLIAT